MLFTLLLACTPAEPPAAALPAAGPPTETPIAETPATNTATGIRPAGAFPETSASQPEPDATLARVPPGRNARAEGREAGIIPATQADITFCTNGGVDLKLDLYAAQNTGGKPAPVVISVHGGGWSAGSKTQGDWLWSVAPGIMAGGVSVASVDYRLNDVAPWPSMIEDVKCAVRYLRANASAHGIDPDHILIMGSSAGGQLASLVGTSDSSAGFDKGQWLDHSSRVSGVVSLFGPTDFTSADWKGRGDAKNATVFGPDAEVRRRASPITWVSRDDPPFLIIQGDHDPVVPPTQAPALAERLQGAGVPAKLIMVENGIHGLHTPNQVPSEADIAAEVVKFIVATAR